MSNFKKVFLVLLIPFLLSFFTDAKIAKASDDLPKISFFGLEHYPLREGDTESFIVTTSHAKNVKYKLLIKSDDNQWQELTNGYTESVPANEPFEIKPEKKYDIGYYTVKVIAERVEDGEETSYEYQFSCENKSNSYVSYNICVDKIYNYLDLGKQNYNLGEVVNIKWNSDCEMNGKFDLKINAYETLSNTWYKNITEYGQSAEWVPLDPGIYIVDVHIQDSTSIAALNSIRQQSSPYLDGTFDSRKLFVIKINDTANIKKNIITKNDTQNLFKNSTVVINVYNGNNKLINTGYGFAGLDGNAIITNYHLIKGGSYAYIISSNGNKYKSSEFTNLNIDQDIAILRIKNSKIPAAKLGNSEEIYIGDKMLYYDVQKRITSNLKITDNKDDSSRKWNKDFLISSKLNRNICGNPVFNESNEIIGMTSYNSQISSFIIPINEIKTLLSVKKYRTFNEIKKADIQAETFPRISAKIKNKYPEYSSYAGKIKISNVTIKQEYFSSTNTIYIFLDIDKESYINFLKIAPTELYTQELNGWMTDVVNYIKPQFKNNNICCVLSAYDSYKNCKDGKIYYNELWQQWRELTFSYGGIPENKIFDPVYKGYAVSIPLIRVNCFNNGNIYAYEYYTQP